MLRGENSRPGERILGLMRMKWPLLRPRIRERKAAADSLENPERGSKCTSTNRGWTGSRCAQSLLLRNISITIVRLRFGKAEWESKKLGYPQDLRDLRVLRRQMNY
jgi:hypothetical protein